METYLLRPVRHPYLVAVFVIAFAMSAPLFTSAQTLSTHKVADGIYTIVGGLETRTPENLGNNATFGAIITSQGVVLVGPGGTYLGAQRLAERIGELSKKPVVAVINTGGQDHR